MKNTSLFVAGVVLALLGSVMLADPRIDVPIAIIVALSGFFLAFFASGPLVIEKPAMPEISDDDRRFVVEGLHSLALEFGYSEPDVGIFGSEPQAEYLRALADQVEKGL